MAEIILVKHGEVELSESEREVVNRVLFGVVDGLGEKHRKAWRRCWNWFLRAEQGEVFTLQSHRPRSGRFHRLHMAIEHAVFEAQERIEDHDGFRVWLKVGAGWVVWAAGPKGGVVPIPRSISYAAADEDEFREYHEKVLDFLRGPHAARYLWPHLGDKADDYMHTVLGRFEQ